MPTSDAESAPSRPALRPVLAALLGLLALEAAVLIYGPHTGPHLRDIATALAADKRPDWWDDAALGVHYAALINAGLLVLLLVTSRFWARGKIHPVVPAPAIQSPRWFWPLTIVAILACFALRYPLASKSLWWDEAWVIQQVSHGKWTPDKKHPGELKFQAHDWKRCAWYYQKPTNHAPMSLLQKASITAWQKLTGAKRERFSDLAARVPALLASCVAVGLMACLLRSWGRRGTGVIAACLLAAHPWAVRYGVDARAYALVIPLCLSGMFAITRIVSTRGGQTRCWVWWGLTEFLWLWAFPNAVIDIAALNLVTAWLLWKGADKRDRSTVLLRLLVTNVFAAMCFVQMFLPELMQARRWVGQEADKHVLDWALVQSTLFQLFLGYELTWPKVPEAAGLVSWGSEFPGEAVRGATYGILVLLIPLLVRLTTTLRPKGAFPKPTILLPTLVLSAMSFALLTWVAQSYYYPRFVIALLPVGIIIVVIDFFRVNEPRHSAKLVKAVAFILGSVLVACVLKLVTPSLLTSAPDTWPPYLIGAAVLAALAFFAESIKHGQAVVNGSLAIALAWFMWAPQLRVLVARPIAPLHDVATFVQSQAASPKPIIACYGLGREVMPVYEPTCVPVENAAGVEALWQRAKAEQCPLYVIYGYNNFNRALLSDGFKLLDDTSRFEDVKAFPGIEPEFYFRVLRAK